jgi:UDP-N-acetylglucosamine acyltransferase
MRSWIVPGGYARVHETAILEGVVILSPDVEIGAFCYIQGPVSIGARTKISPHVVIGTDGEHRKLGPQGKIVIGADVIIREFVAIQRGTGDRDTSIGDRCMLMDHVHVAHDVTLAEDVTVSPNVVFGGHTRVHRGATIGIAAVTHQHSTIGAYAMVGMGSVVTKDVPPFALVCGNPARYVRENEIGAIVCKDPGQYRAQFIADARRTSMPKI